MTLTIAVDAMGGDYAPRAAVEGAHAAAVEDGAAILLVGREEVVRAELARLGEHGGKIEGVRDEGGGTMGDPATAPLRKKRRSSIRVACELVEAGRAAAVVTAGNT